MELSCYFDLGISNLRNTFFKKISNLELEKLPEIGEVVNCGTLNFFFIKLLLKVCFCF